jgi:REP element-mobilizing transposase RayT
MPEHVHLLVGEPRRSSLSVALQVLKQQTSRKLKQRGEVQFWKLKMDKSGFVVSHPSLEKSEGWGTQL